MVGKKLGNHSTRQDHHHFLDVVAYLIAKYHIQNSGQTAKVEEKASKKTSSKSRTRVRA